MVSLPGRARWWWWARCRVFVVPRGLTGLSRAFRRVWSPIDSDVYRGARAPVSTSYAM